MDDSREAVSARTCVSAEVTNINDRIERLTSCVDDVENRLKDILTPAPTPPPEKNSVESDQSSSSLQGELSRVRDEVAKQAERIEDLCERINL